MFARIMSLIIGYCFGNIVTAEIIARRLTGKSAREIGTSGNPGMANIMAHVGFKAGLAVLAGDLAKCAAAAFLSWFLFGKDLGQLAFLYAGLGCTLGHNYPVWMKLKGGKGVATTCAGIFLYDPLIGLGSMIAGMLLVFATQYLSLGGFLIPLCFTVIAGILKGAEPATLGAVFTILAFLRNKKQLMLISSGQAEKVDVLGAIRKKVGNKK